MDFKEKVNTLLIYLEAPERAWPFEWDEHGVPVGKHFPNFSLSQNFYNNLQKSVTDIQIIDAVRICRLNSSFNLNWCESANKLINLIWKIFTESESSNYYQNDSNASKLKDLKEPDLVVKSRFNLQNLFIKFRNKK